MNSQEKADKLVDALRSDAAARDLAGAEPEHEVGLLKESGLLTLLIPAEHGGAGESWLTANAVTRIVSAADANVGHLLGYHYLQLWRGELFDRPDLVTRLWQETVAGNHFWAGVSNPLDAALELTPVDGGFHLNGRKTFATGTAVADRLVVSATRTDNAEKLTFVLDARAPGITYLRDWDNIGQRLTSSGGVEFADAFLPADDVLGPQPEQQSPRLSLAPIAFQLFLTQIYVGIAEGALIEAADYTRHRTRPWFLSGVDNAVDDPHVLAGYGELVAQVRAAGALTDDAARALGEAFDRGDDLTEADRAEAAVTISAAKVVATRAVNETTSKVFEFVGARGTANKYALDRFWRNARTLTLHDPVVYKAREVGAHFLTGERPPFTGYT
ncbi:acyl-CoA dehydrogenase family protein [Actinophytocola sp.]|uniref:acyl-CoA dehydrogenase family protein n=1 Tax=Actinophytocola sp. TaxID=1872138 RepID=UPI002ED1DC0A